VVQTQVIEEFRGPAARVQWIIGLECSDLEFFALEPSASLIVGTIDNGDHKRVGRYVAQAQEPGISQRETRR